VLHERGTKEVSQHVERLDTYQVCWSHSGKCDVGNCLFYSWNAHLWGVNAWDDAPGGGLFVLLVWAIGITGGVLCGGLCSESLWKHRRSLDQTKVLNVMKGASALLGGCSLVPAVLILPWTGPHQQRRVALSIGVATALAAVAIWLIYRGSKRLTVAQQ